jgi:branched-subunit amino acid ABC-type transport system permease component
LSIIKFTGSFWWAVLLAPIPVALIAIVIEVFFLRPTYARGRLDQVLLTFGFSFIITDLVESIWGREVFGIDEPDLLGSSVEVFGGVFPSYRLALLGFGIIVAIALWFLIEKTRAGAMVRAGVDDPHTAVGIGLNVPLLLTTTFASGAALAGLAGVVAGPLLNVFSGMDVEMTIPAFIVIVIGGMGSLKGAAIGSVLIGIADTFGKTYAPSLSTFLIYFAMIAILLIRPGGLFGQRSTGV